MRSWILLLLAFMATLVVMADDIEVNEEDDAVVDDDDTYEDDDEAHEVSTSYFIPEYQHGRLPVGKEFTILVDFSNKGQDVFNVTKVAAFLHSPFDLNYYIQNFTAKVAGGVAAPSSQISLEYKVTPDAKLEPLEFWLSGYVEYTMEGSDDTYQQMFVNTTVELFDDRSSFDGSTLFTIVMVAGAAAVVWHLGVANSVEKVTGKKQKIRFTKEMAAMAPTDEDWGVETYKQSSKSSRARRGTKAPKKTE